MFSDLTPVTTLPTRDLARAREFYEGKLGLTAVDENPVGVTYRCGEGKIFVYESEFAGSNKATSLFVGVPRDRFDAEVDALRKVGVTFQTYDLEGMTWEGDVAVMDEYKTVWFTDPDGNILNIISE
jgi:catechol 2,3-dioxygenase-like lactoylglutathione lyase family enzyme